MFGACEKRYGRRPMRVHADCPFCCGLPDGCKPRACLSSTGQALMFNPNTNSRLTPSTYSCVSKCLSVERELFTSASTSWSIDARISASVKFSIPFFSARLGVEVGGSYATSKAESIKTTVRQASCPPQVGPNTYYDASLMIQEVSGSSDWIQRACITDWVWCEYKDRWQPPGWSTSHKWFAVSSVENENICTEIKGRASGTSQRTSNQWSWRLKSASQCVK